jgi:16S rRNA (guanine(966)-N(2))-methyltransferase RsmD
MRVIAGRAKGRRLKSVPGTATRPISGRVKESLFAILGRQVEGARFLDLFAGTGSVGIEALSREAQEVVFVEAGRKAVEAIKDNLALTGLSDRAEVIQKDVFRYLKATPDAFDIIYLAPPQYRGLWAKTMRALDERPGLLAEEGLVVAQMYPKEYEELELETLELVDQRKYGSTLLCFYAAKGGRSKPA